MPVEFDRPVGACADVAELEYISALMQTEKLFLRQEGSLTARDIHYFLKSRHGLEVPVEQIEKEIMVELGGTIAANAAESDINANGDSDRNSVHPPTKVSRFDVPDVLVYDSMLDTPSDQEDVEVAARISTSIRPPEVHPEEHASLEDRPVPRPSKRVSWQTNSLRHRPSSRDLLLRLSQAINHEDLEKYHQYISKQRMTTDLPEIEEDVGENSYTDDSIAEALAEADLYDEEMKLDLAQITALILIPKLREIRYESDQKVGPEDTQKKSSEIDIIDLALTSLLQETGLKYGQEINEEALEQILSHSLHTEWREEMHKNMMNSLRDISNPRFDRETFLNILTDDVLAYDIDIMTCTRDTAIEEVNAMDSCQSNATNDNTRQLKRIFTASNIDTNADTYRSSTWQILAWYAIVVLLFTYAFRGVQPVNEWNEPQCTRVDSVVLCAIAISTQNWLELLLKLTILGLPFYYGVTLGNSIYYGHVEVLTLVAIAIAAFWTYAPYLYRANWGVFHSGPTEEQIATGEEKANNREIVGPLAVVMGSLLILVQLAQIVPRGCCNPGYLTNNRRSAIERKRAAACKVDRLVRNAAKCHILEKGSQSGTEKGKTKTQGGIHVRPLSGMMVKYQQTFAETEPAGGILWTWRKVRDRSLFYEEGVWIWPRLLASNSAQWFTVLIWIGVELFLIVLLSQEEQLWEDGMTNDQLMVVGLVGFPPALCVSFYISLVYVPSAMSSVLKYRSGQCGSLRDRRFLQNRFAMDSANLLFGAAFWTCMCSSASFFVICSLFTFFCTWSQTQNMMIGFVANIMGALITVILKQIIMLIIRNRWSRGYYRSHPAAVNFSNTIQEVWNLGLTTLTALVRGVKFMAIFLLYLGRIDGEVFAPGVGWFMDSIPLDGLPHCFYRDVLLHEAHRHPLIERLGFLYMMKLRMGSNFGTTGGAAWRLVFTCVLMPWMRKHRQGLGICGEGKCSRRKKSVVLSGLSKEALIDNFVSLEERYQALSEKVKSLTQSAGHANLASGSLHLLKLEGERGSQSLNDLTEEESNS